ncbi:MAG TPA: DinB family protein [Pyrinomonadaceae bacterium]|nr:DinB family protein [Pyrinomonadaceae bacterium]
MAETLSQVLDSLADTPEILAALVSNLQESELRVEHPMGEFSIVEHICHLRDIEIEGYGIRINRILKEASPALPDIDGSQLALERDYNSQLISVAFEQFRHARQKNIEVLHSLEEEELNREGMLEGMGAVNLRRLLCLMHEHDESHLSAIRVVREWLSNSNQ